MNFKVILIVVLAGLALVFVAQNLEVVSVSFLLWEISMSRAVLMLFCLLAGFIIGWFMNSYLSYRKEKKEVKKIIDK
ncbi:MAG TPA: LapA family protein [Deltaproteobacteria bacterium]|nr:LapA family protein [Deltaproteobacteria bacterium]